MLSPFFPHSSVSKEPACNAGDLGKITGLGRSPGEGNGNPLQYSCLENPMERGAWWATVCGVVRVRHNLATKLLLLRLRLSTSPTSSILLLFSFYRWGNGATGCFSIFSSVTQLVSCRARCWTEAFWLQSLNSAFIKIYWLADCCSVAQTCQTLRNPMDYSTPHLPVLHYLPEFAQAHVHWVSDAIQPSHPLSSTSSLALSLSQHQDLFQWAGSLHQVAKVLELQLLHQSFQ